MPILTPLSRRSIIVGTTALALSNRFAWAQPKIKSVVVAGATGRTGRRIVEKAAAAGYQVRGLTRNPERARQRYGNIAEWVACDVRNPYVVAAAVKDMDAVFCAIGYTQFAGPNGGQFVDYLGVRHLIDHAVKESAKHFVLVSSGSAGPARNQRDNPLFGYVGYWKTKAENHLKQSGMPFTIIGPAGLLDEPGGRRAIRFMKRPEYIQLPMVKRIIDIGDVATVAVASLTELALENKSFALLNDEGPPSFDWRQEISDLPPEQS